MPDLPAGEDTGDEAIEEIEETELEDQEAEGEGGETDGEADDAGDAGDEAAQNVRQEGQARNVGRGPRGQPYGQRIRTLESQLATQKAEFEKQLQTLVQQRQGPTPAELAEQQRMERERLELMSPQEVAAYYHQKTIADVEQRTQAIALTLWDQNDQRDYEAMLAATPAYRRLDEKVNELRRQAPQVSRRILLATAIGMRALEQGGAAKTRAATSAAAGAERHRARPSNGRGDVPAERQRRGDDLEERLRDQLI